MSCLITSCSSEAFKMPFGLVYYVRGCCVDAPRAFSEHLFSEQIQSVRELDEKTSMRIVVQGELLYS